MYVCGPTVYSDAHLGNVRTFLSFDIIYRYLEHLGYKVRYVRNITDVGHLTDDHDEGEDKIAKRARLEKLEPMEIVQKYKNDFHEVMMVFNIRKPSIEPTATGHIIEQIETVKRILDRGLGYEVNGSVYFDVEAYSKKHHYGELSGRVIEELMANSRELEGQEDKRNPVDFALWKKALPTHIMRWPSPWGEGFPGWHLECSVMSTKYLGDTFDIHGGGMDLKFPHHECELAQCRAASEQLQANYWIHANMLTVNGQKMSKSLGNSFLPRELISGTHRLLDKSYSPMTIRFFMLQSHYSSTLDISNEALQAAEKGYHKLMNGLRFLKEGTIQDGSENEKNNKAIDQINSGIDNFYRAMNDDFNTAQALGHLFNLLKKVNGLQLGQLTHACLGEETIEKLKTSFITFTEDILGLNMESQTTAADLLPVLIELYQEAKTEKDYEKVDQIRTRLKETGIVLKDTKFGIDWAIEE